MSLKKLSNKLFVFAEYQLLAFLLLSVVIVFVYEITSAVSPNYIKWLLIFQIILIVVLLIIRRVTDNKIVTELTELQYTSNEEFISLYERSPAAYMTIDQDGQILMFNPATVHLLSATTDSLPGVNFLDLVVDEEDDSLSILKGKIDSGATIVDEEVRVRNLNGEIRYMLISVYKYKVGGQRLMLLMDITNQKMVDTAKSEFVALATHQLRTPIAAIRWNLELLQSSLKEVVTDKQVKYMTKIERNVMRMIDLINDFLSVSKLEMGTFATNLEPINMTEFFDSVVDEFVEKISEKQLKVNRSEAPENFVFKSDSRLLHIIISNLMSNSVKYARSEGSVVLQYELSGNVLVITVADDGIGIPESELDKLFTKFYRASNAQSHQTEGTGLGLYIVKQSVEQLGGTVEVASDEDKGARFTIQLPVS